MKILKDSIVTLASEGRLTLQVPEWDIVNGQCTRIDTEIAPDEWFCRLKYYKPVVGKQEGFLFLTEKGFEANKDKLKIAFENSNLRNGGKGKWHLFEEHAKDHFAKVKKAQNKLINELQNKLAQAQSFIV